MASLRQDLAFAARTLRRSPGFTLVAVATLALGIGLNTSMFSVVNSLLMRPLPYPDGQQLMRVYGTSPESRDWPFSVGYVDALREQSPVFERLGVFAVWSATLTEHDRPPEELVALRVSADFLPALGVEPALGRMFTAEEDRPGTHVAILTHRTWVRQFRGDPGIVGRTVRIDAAPVTVVGVMPERFDAPLVFGPIDLLRPLGTTVAERENRGYRWLHLVGRLRPGVSQAEAEAELQTVASRIAEEYPQDYGRQTVRLVPLHASGTHDTLRSIVWLVLGLSGFVLLIACANLANLQLVRATGRGRELAVRSALGAPRSRLFQALGAESLLLAIIGGGAGILLASWFNAWIGSHFHLHSGVTLEIPLDVRVLGFAILVTLLTGVVSGTMPGWLATRGYVAASLRQGGRGTTSGGASARLRHALVVCELALALTLLAGAGVLVNGIERFVDRDPGWNTEGVLFGYIDLPQTQYPEQPQMLAFFEQVREQAATMPGVESAAVGWTLPMWEFYLRRQVTLDGQAPAADTPLPVAYVNGVMPGYFETLGVRLLDGRDFTPRDDRDAPEAAIINESMAQAFWPGERAVGKRIGSPDPEGTRWMEVVGVVNDVQFATNLAAPPTRFQLYRPFAQEPWGYASVALRTRAVPATLMAPLRQLVAELDPELPVRDLTTVSDAVNRDLANVRLIMRVLAGFAVLGLLLAALGIYGVMAHVVAQRTAEFGVRMAFGARMRDVLSLVLGMGLRLAVIGALIGVAGALTLSHLVRAIAPEVPGRDAWPIVLTTGVLVAVALLACYLPARRAARVDPMIALRAE